MAEAGLPSEIRINLSAGAFSIEAAKRAAYSLMERATTVFQEGGDGLSVVLSPLDSHSDLDLLERDFRRELLDQDLRINLEARTEPIRTAILGLAFSRTGLQDG